MPGVKYYTGVVGFSLLSTVFTTYNAFYFITLDPWDERVPKGLGLRDLLPDHPRAVRGPARRRDFPFPPPDHSRRGIVGRRHLRARGPRRQGRRVPRQADTRSSWRRQQAPGVRVAHDHAPAERAPGVRRRGPGQGAQADASISRRVYQTLQAFLGGYFVNYFNRFGRVWQVYVQAEAEDRARADGVDLFYVRNAAGTPVPLSSFVTMRPSYRPRVHPALQRVPLRPDQRHPPARRQHESGHEGARGGLRPDHAAPRWASTTWACRSRSRRRPRACRRASIFGFSLLVVFLILAAQYESWSLPFAVLLSTPIAVFGAFAAPVHPPLRARRLLRDRPRDADRARRQERHPHRRVLQGRARARRADRRRGAGRARACASARSS